MVPAPGLTGRTELVCVYCDKLDPLEIEEAKKWAESPYGSTYFRESLKRALSQ